jgi:hypothetical protein
MVWLSTHWEESKSKDDPKTYFRAAFGILHPTKSQVLGLLLVAPFAIYTKEWWLIPVVIGIDIAFGHMWWFMVLRKEKKT